MHSLPGLVPQAHRSPECSCTARVPWKAAHGRRVEHNEGWMMASLSGLCGTGDSVGVAAVFLKIQYPTTPWNWPVLMNGRSLYKEIPWHFEVQLVWTNSPRFSVKEQLMRYRNHLPKITAAIPRPLEAEDLHGTRKCS